MHFARYARKVSMVIRGNGLKQTLSQYLVDRILAAPQIEVLPHTEVSARHGDHVLSAITLTNRQTGQQQTFNTSFCTSGVCRTRSGPPNLVSFATQRVNLVHSCIAI